MSSPSDQSVMTSNGPVPELFEVLNGEQGCTGMDPTTLRQLLHNSRSHLNDVYGDMAETALMMAIDDPSCWRMAHLLLRREDIDTRISDANGATAVVKASNFGVKEVHNKFLSKVFYPLVKKFIQQGGDINAYYGAPYYGSALKVAARSGSKMIVLELLRNGARNDNSPDFEDLEGAHSRPSEVAATYELGTMISRYFKSTLSDK